MILRVAQRRQISFQRCQDYTDDGDADRDWHRQEEQSGEIHAFDQWGFRRNAPMIKDDAYRIYRNRDERIYKTYDKSPADKIFLLAYMV